MKKVSRFSLKYIEGWLRQYKLGTIFLQRFPLYLKYIFRYYLSRKYIKGGYGIEIGPSFLPLNITENADIKYVDLMTAEELCSLYPQIPENKVKKIDIIDDGETLKSFDDESLDFIIANHFIEHTINPGQTILNFLRVLKKDGIIFLAIPNRVNIFDYKRPLTEVEHLIDVFEKGTDELIEDHYHEVVEIVEKIQPDKIHERIRQLKEERFSIHYHTYELENFIPLIEYIADKGHPVKILETRYFMLGTDEFIVIMKKTI